MTEATPNFIATWAIGMIGVALDNGISEKMIYRALDPRILPELIKIAKQHPDYIEPDDDR